MSSRWHKSWEEGRIGFHASEVNQSLIAHQDRLLDEPGQRVFVPLCGKTLDMVWLADQGHEVIGVELVPQAIDEFLEEQQIDARSREDAKHLRHESDRISLLCGDIFDVQREQVPGLTRIWDRAALVALDPPTRRHYASKLMELGGEGTRMLLNAFEYDHEVMEGPPFSVPDAEVRELFAKARVELLSERDAIDDAPQFKARGHEYWIVRNYLIEF